MTAIKEQLKNFWDPIREGLMGADDSASAQNQGTKGEHDKMSL
jgi:hypothetical protein